MSIIQAKVIDRVIELTESPLIYSGAKNVDSIQFQFDAEWSGFTKTAVFYHDEANQFMAQLSNDICIIPHEVLAKDGRLYFGVYGESGDKVITSEVITYIVDKGVLTDPDTSDDPTFWDKLLEIKGEILQAKDDAHAYADEAQEWADKAEQNAEHFYNGIIASGETYSGIASNKGVKLHKVVGKTTQQTTNGYQLFDASKLATTSAGGATVTNNSDGSFTISGSGNLTSNFSKIYKLSGSDMDIFKVGKIKIYAESSCPYVYAKFSNSSGKLFEISTFKQLENNLTEEMINSDGFSVEIGFFGSSESKITNTTIKPMVYQDGDGTWEPYTGGQPAPNPDYPMEIENVEITKIDSQNENLITFPYSSNNGHSHNGITYTYGDDGVIIASGTATDKSIFTCINQTGKYRPSKGRYFLSFGRSDLSTSTYYGQIFNNKNDNLGTIDYGNGVAFDFENEKNSWNIAIIVNKGQTLNNVEFRPIMVKGESSIDWVRYRGATVETSLSLAEGETYIEGQPITRYRKQITFDGSSDEDWMMMDGNTEGKCRRFKISASYMASDTLQHIKSCNRLSINTGFIYDGGNVDSYAYYISSEPASIRMCLPITNLSDFKTWLQTHPVTVEYELATPTTETVEVPTVPSYNPHTNIWTDNTVSTDMEWELLGNSDNSLEIEALQKQIAELSATFSAVMALMPSEVQASIIESDVNKLLGGI